MQKKEADDAARLQASGRFRLAMRWRKNEEGRLVCEWVMTPCEEKEAK